MARFPLTAGSDIPEQAVCARTYRTFHEAACAAYKWQLAGSVPYIVPCELSVMEPFALWVVE